MSASAVLRLQKVGFTAEQVEALAAFMDGQAAGKADLLEVRNDLEKAIAALDAKIGSLEAKIAGLASEMDARFAEVETRIAHARAEAKADIAVLRAELVAMERRLETQVAQSKNDLLKWLIPLLFGQLAGFAAIVKLL